MGEYCGRETHTLTVNEMPAHNHDVNDPGHEHKWQAGKGWAAGGNQEYARHDAGYDAKGPTTKDATGITIQEKGGGASHNIMQPSLAVRFMIRWSGDTRGTTLPREPASVAQKVSPKEEKAQVDQK